MSETRFPADLQHCSPDFGCHDFGNWSFDAEFGMLTPGMTEVGIARASFRVSYNLLHGKVGGPLQVIWKA